VQVSADPRHLGLATTTEIDMKFSTGNQIQGKIMEIRKGGVTAIVYVTVPGDATLEVSVTIPALETLELYEGKPVVLMINPGDIIIGCE
jgi:molybdopterin-binding protein